ncbi:MAG: carboxypeptidase-like regulatory domain-containing protein [Saprospiraceae bacterium]
MKNIIYITFLFLGISIGQLSAQDEVQDTTALIQFSGLVLDGGGEELEPIPFVTVAVDGTSRGTYTNWEGFFSIVVGKGDAITFSAVGYQTVNFEIPDTLTDNRYSLVQLMSMDMINLPETVVFPWPSREHFKLEFLAMETDNAIVSNVERTMSPEKMEALKRGLPYDGVESGSFYLRQQAKSYYHYGQIAPMNIFNPLAWRDFFKAWKNGDFKKKKDK